jgi:pyruvate/2-oxoacid:ferredoxin oxidoreductase beta subunit
MTSSRHEMVDRSDDMMMMMMMMMMMFVAMAMMIEPDKFLNSSFQE